MAPQDASQFKAVLMGVYALYGKDLSEALLSIWWAAMRPYELPAVRDALNRHAVDPDRGQFPPKPADVTRLIEGGTQDGALVAWTRVIDAVRSIGTYRTVCFDDPIINAVIRDMGGWPELGTVSEDELPFKAKEFENRYRGYRLRGKVDGPQKLLGRIDMENVCRGFPEQESVLIGNQSRAKTLLERGPNDKSMLAIALESVR